jgi:predicted transcriptional regulator/DNA-binding XRE family transcriptional regulator
MPQGQLTGTRIRERRMMQGMRQAELAQKAGISASYLNLIEHNRRRIGGKLLLNLANALGVEPSILSEGAEAAMIATLGEALAADTNAAPVEETAATFAGRYPGWAELLARRHRRVMELERTVETLTDRLTHDPYLAAALHEVLSSVTAIRSTAGILAETPQLEPEWRDRFHRNINEDAARLAESAQGLVAYLDDGGEDAGGLASPQEELEAFLKEASYHFTPLEVGKRANITSLLQGAEMLQSTAGRGLAHRYLEHYADDSRDMPLSDMLEVLRELGPDPAAVARSFNVSLSRAMRRMAQLPPSPELPDIGLVSCDASGTLIFRKGIEGFSLPRFGAACPKWPLYHALSQPLVPIHQIVSQDPRDEQRFDAYAIAEPATPPSFGQMPLFHAHMLLIAQPPVLRRDQVAAPLGVSCRICPRSECEGRREPSILTEGV